MKRAVLLGLPLCLAVTGRAAAGPPLLADTYNQWKEAQAGPPTAPGQIRAAEGFAVELVRPAREGEGSWVALAFLPDGNLILAREDKGLRRYDPATGAEGPLHVADDSLLECRGLLAAHGALYANANNSHAFCRLRDGDGDGRFEQVETLRVTPGGVGHGRNQLALGPDGAIYSIHGDDVQPPEGGFTTGSAYAHGADDRMLPFAWDRFNWSHTVHPPAGHLVRTDPEGKSWQIVCGGLRNPFGIAFNKEGEAFTYDADIEWDVGLPWYRPTRVLHLVSGADYGWRGGSRALPAWMPDTAPPALDIGKGSPTAIRFGTLSAWPEPWRSALFMSDWAYGVIYAVQLTPEGASYRGTSSVFVEGRPLNVTGLDFGPDGALYFTTGGRRTQSGLYRIIWRGDGAATSASVAASAATAEARALRRMLESFHGRQDPKAFEAAWPHLDHRDPWIRQAARIALETDPACAENVLSRAAATPLGQLTAALAAARTCRDLPEAGRLLRRLGDACGGAGPRPAWMDQPDHQLLFLRCVEILLLRHRGDTPPRETSSGGTRPRGSLERVDHAAIAHTILPRLLPNSDHRCGRLACEVMAAWDHPETVSRTFQALNATPPPSQEDAVHYLVTLRGVKSGWTFESRRQWLHWLRRARSEFSGSSALPTTLNHMRAEFETGLTVEEKSALAPEFAALDQTAATTVPPPARPFVNAWTMADFTDAIAATPAPPNPSHGRKLFAEATCAACHRAAPGAPKGGTIGPDLTGVGQRFDRRALFESILDPWKTIAPQYKTASVTLQNGAIHEGRVLSENTHTLHIVTNPVEPESATQVPRSQITRLVELSAMPPSLVNGFSREEISALVDWLQAGAP